MESLRAYSIGLVLGISPFILTLVRTWWFDGIHISYLDFKEGTLSLGYAYGLACATSVISLCFAAYFFHAWKTVQKIANTEI